MTDATGIDPTTDTDASGDVTDEEFVADLLGRGDGDGSEGEGAGERVGIDADLDLEALVAEAERHLAGALGVTLQEGEEDGEGGEGDGEDDGAGDESADTAPAPPTAPDADPGPGPDSDAGPGESATGIGAGGAGEADESGSPHSGNGSEDGWERVGAAYEALTGSRPSYDDLTDIQNRATNYDALLNQLQSLPADQQQIVAQIIQGEFDAAAYAQQVIAASQPDQTPPTRRDPLYYDDDDTPAVDPTVEELRALRRDMQEQQVRAQQTEYAQQQAQFNQRVEQDLTRLYEDIQAANPTLTDDQFAAIGAKVNERGMWLQDMQRDGDIYGAYLRHFSAHATAEGVTINPPGQTTQAAQAQAQAPATPPTATPPIAEEVVRESHARQAASSAISGSSTPARRRRRSTIPTGDGKSADQTSTRPSNPAELEAEIAAAVQDMMQG